METTFNALQLHALLLDAITFFKFKSHLAPNWRSTKVAFCTAVGISPKCSNNTLIQAIKQVYVDNKQGDKFEETLEKFNVGYNGKLYQTTFKVR